MNDKRSKSKCLREYAKNFGFCNRSQECLLREQNLKARLARKNDFTCEIIFVWPAAEN